MVACCAVPLSIVQTNVGGLPGRNPTCHGHTLKSPSLTSVPAGVVTWTLPVVTPEGTLARIRVFETTLKIAGVPLKLTAVAPLRSVPKISMRSSAAPKEGWSLTNGPRPTDRLYIVPQLKGQISSVVPP